MNIGIIVQARLGSSRLPDKIILPFYNGKSIIDILLEKLHKINNVKIIVATTVNPADDKLAKYLSDKGEIIYRGSENDVLERFISAAKDNGCDAIVRICSDNPFIDIEGIELLIEAAKKSHADYIGFKINGKPSIQTHFGFWGEFVRLEALETVYHNPDASQADHEHVTYHIYNHPDDFSCEFIDAPDFLQNRNDIRLTVDTADDFSNAGVVFKSLNEKTRDFSLEEVIGFLDSHPEIKDSMKKNILSNTK